MVSLIRYGVFEAKPVTGLTVSNLLLSSHSYVTFAAGSKSRALSTADLFIGMLNLRVNTWLKVRLSVVTGRNSVTTGTRAVSKEGRKSVSVVRPEITSEARVSLKKSAIPLAITS